MSSSVKAYESLNKKKQKGQKLAGKYVSKNAVSLQRDKAKVKKG